MEGGQMSFKEKYQNRNFIYLYDNKTVRDFANSYTNQKTKFATYSVIHYMFESIKEDNPDFKLDDFFNLNPVQARRLIWSTVQKYLQAEKYRTALNIKSYGSQLYYFANEEKGLSIKWSKKHKVPMVKVREGQTPTHEQVYRLVNCATHLDAKAVFLLMYSSGLKGEGILNLTVQDYKEAKQFRKEVKEEFLNQLNNTQDPEEAKELNYIIQNLPAIIKVTFRIYPKRFTDTTGKSWYPAFISKDAEAMIDKYLEEYRTNATDDEPLFPGRLSGKKQGQIQLSKWLKFNLKKYHRLTGELKKTSPSLLRRSFFNRLISGGMSDINREYIMGHSLQVKAHYYDWSTQKKNIISQYLRCNFNRHNGNYGEQISTLKEDSKTKEEKIKELEEKLRYFESPQFTSNVIAKVLESKDNPFNHINNIPAKTVKVKIPIDSGKELARLLNDGYSIIFSDSEHFILEKEIE